MTDLRDRIAAVLLPDLEYAAAYNPTTRSPEDHAAALADAVIAALGLREEWGALDEEDSGFLADSREELKPRSGETVKRRYVTEWENDE